jgi:D-arabinose 5-phosphate isomerase GutQ
MVDYKKYAKEVFAIESKAISDLSKQLDDDFNQSVETVLKSKFQQL